MSTAASKLIAGASSALLASAPALASEWDIDPAHSQAQFSVRHMMVSTVRGQFDKVSGTVSLDDRDPGRSKVEVTIDASSIDTREPKRNEHLKSADFFDVAKYPTLSFRSTKVEKVGSQLRITGELTMHGVTRPVVLISDGLSEPQKNPWGQTVRGASATGKLSRKEFGLTWNKALESGGVVVGDEVQLQIDVELVAKAPAAPSAAK